MFCIVKPQLLNQQGIVQEVRWEWFDVVEEIGLFNQMSCAYWGLLLFALNYSLTAQLICRRSMYYGLRWPPWWRPASL